MKTDPKIIVTFHQVSWHGERLATVEASDIGLRPGQWPERIETTIGSQKPFLLFKKQMDADNDLLWIDYLQANGEITLRVYND